MLAGRSRLSSTASSRLVRPVEVNSVENVILVTAVPSHRAYVPRK